jgi:aryl-alcohol dehydrogenase-like predicted oxidoreductase
MQVASGEFWRLTMRASASYSGQSIRRGGCRTLKYRRLGRTELDVSEIALGTVELGMEYGIPAAGGPLLPSKKDAQDILNKALDLGINFIDTARAYGTSEAIIGHTLKGRRNEFILASKVQCQENPASPNRLLRDHIISSVHESLKTLQTDVIDLMQVHSAPVDLIRRGDVVAILQDLQKAGYIRFIGVTVYGEDAAIGATQAGTYDCIQLAYNLLDRTPELRVFPAVQSEDTGVIVRSVLLKGALTYRYRCLPDSLRELKSAIESTAAIAEKRSLSLPELAFRFVLGQPAISTALVGAASAEELESAVSFSDRAPLTDDILAEIEAICVARPEQLNPGNWAIP